MRFSLPGCFGIGVTVVSLGTTWGCSSETKNQTVVQGEPRTPRVEEVQKALRPLADAACGWEFRCCNADEISYTLGGTSDQAACTDLFMTLAGRGPYYHSDILQRVSGVLGAVNELGYGFDLGHVKIDSKGVDACVASLEAQACSAPKPADHCAPKDAAATDDPCSPRKIFVGDLKEGGRCDPNGAASGCAADLWCLYTSGNDGVCVKRPVVGALCVADYDCGDFLCDYATGKCTAGKAAGDACEFADPANPVPGTEKERCGTGLVCDTVNLVCADQNCAGGVSCQRDEDCPDGLGCYKNRCGKPLPAGAECYQTKDCAVGDCTYDQTSSRSVCKPPGAPGDECQGDYQCASHYCKYGTTSGTCAATVALGGVCASGQGNECTSGKCIYDPVSGTSICGPGPKPGDACTSDNDCHAAAQLFCVDLKCAQAPFADGSSCTTPDQCESKTCSNSKCVGNAKVGEACGGDEPPCVDSAYCDASGTKAVCTAKKSRGQTCTQDRQCYGSCQPTNGELRCTDIGPGQVFCGGSN